jgi:RNA polymerase sigma-70 factor (ECF subfamily)
MRLQVQDWQTIVTEQGPLVWRTAYRLLANSADAADCFQETFLAALELSRREPVRNLSGLLVRLATTRAIDRLRQRVRLEREAVGGIDADETCTATDPAVAAQTRELAGQLREAIARLPEQEAKVFCLRYLNDMSYRQIARELRIGVSAVGVALYRAKAKLREALGTAQMDEGGPKRQAWHLGTRDEVYHEKT